jgi:hypothetical protein
VIGFVRLPRIHLPRIRSAWARHLLRWWWALVGFVLAALTGNFLSVALAQPPSQWAAAARSQVATLVSLAVRYPLLVGVSATVLVALSVAGWRASVTPAGAVTAAPNRTTTTKSHFRAPALNWRAIFNRLFAFLAYTSLVLLIVLALSFNALYAHFVHPWIDVASPNASPYGDALSAVAVVDATHAWAVGAYRDRAGNQQTLIERWDGAAWTVTPSPSPGASENTLSAVAVVDATHAWAVGAYRDRAGNQHALIEHWDGAAWTVTPSPNANSFGDALSAIAAVDAAHAWAVGAYRDHAGKQQALIERWDGAAWTVAPSPSPGAGESTLSGVAVVGLNRAWAVGRHNDASGGSVAVIAQWDGAAWSLATSPKTGHRKSVLNAVAASDADHVWAVGSTGDESVAEGMLIERWDGNAWSPAVNSDLRTADRVLEGIMVLDAHHAWAVGEYPNIAGIPQTLIVQWDGANWSEIPTLDPGSESNTLNGIAAFDDNHVWAVGQYMSGSDPSQTLVVRRDA